MRNSIVAFACAVALTGCGDETLTPKGQDGGDTAPVVLQGAVNDKGKGDVTSGTLDVQLGDSFFAPTYLKGKPGAKVTLNLKNAGAMAHTFTTDQPKVDVTVDAGGTGTAGLTLPSSGALAFYCKFHKGQGMQGAFYFSDNIVVVPPGSSSSATSSGDDGGAYGQ